MIELTPEQHQALQTESAPPRMHDPQTNRIYVLLESCIFDRIKEILSEEEDRNALEGWLDLVEEAHQDFLHESSSES
jgi:hypothetical protein